MSSQIFSAKYYRHTLGHGLRPLLIAALVLSIPAFYMVLNGALSPYQNAGRWLYALVALLMGLDFWLCHTFQSGRIRRGRLFFLDSIILFGAIVSAIPQSSEWMSFEWILRLLYCTVVFLRLATLLARYVVAPHRLLQIASIGLLLLAIAGEGFLLLEPKVQTYADGVWLAFLTGATLGYGDMVPSTPASRIFAVFIVLLGYALFSIFTASISAILVGEDEKRLRYELHADTRMLRNEIAELRKELQRGLHLQASPAQLSADAEAVQEGVEKP